MDNNRHLNLFNHYTQKGSIPIENNISRGLAILLNENNLVLDRFIDLVNDKILNNQSTTIIPKPQRLDEREIGIQQSIKKIVTKYSDPRKIIGITLTTAAPVNLIEDAKEDNNNLITDIVISCQDTLVIIEVKKDATDARLQLEQQINSIYSAVSKEENTPVKELVDVTWEEVIALLQDVHNLESTPNNSILAHYLKHLEVYYQEWFPVSLLTNIDMNSENKEAINKRIKRMIQNLAGDEEVAPTLLEQHMISLESEITNRAQLSLDDMTKTLKITMWSGDTKEQGRYLLTNTSGDLSWIYNKQYSVDGQELDVVIRPYLRLAHTQKTRILEYFNLDYSRESFGTSKSQWLELFTDITWRWNRADWDKLKQLLGTKYKGMIDMGSLSTSFFEGFEDTNRTQADVSFGFKSEISIPLEVIAKYEKSVNKENDTLAAYVNEVIAEHIRHIE